jgi:hypothetical protein
MVCEMNPLNAAHLPLVALDCARVILLSAACVEFLVELVFPCVLPAANCAMFFPNLSLSIRSNFSLRFVAPGLLLIDFCLIIPFAATLPPSSPRSCKSGRASANPSKVVTSFLLGRRRFKGFLCAFSIRFTKAECLMVRLSFLELINLSDISAPARCVAGRAINPDPDFEVRVLERIEWRFLGAVGAWGAG